MRKLFIGLMSGTSADGIDASLICTDGEHELRILANLYLPYSADLKQQILNLMQQPQVDKTAYATISLALTLEHAHIVQQLLEQSQYSAKQITAIGFHGQTIHHQAQPSFSWQAGNSSLLANQTKIDVIHNFRESDIANNGQGAPLLPIYHQLLLRNHRQPAVIVNIGGVANLTYSDQQTLIAFDTGPGNGLLDEFIQKHYKQDFDAEGLIAAQGKVDFNLIDNWLQHPYFATTFPKSLDRYSFTAVSRDVQTLSPVDGAATLSYFSAATIIAGLKLLPQPPNHLYLCGGGTKNLYLYDCLKTLLQQYNPKSTLSSLADLDLDPDFIESQGFGYLAARYHYKLPSSFNTTTGAQSPVVCGSYTPYIAQN